MRRRSPTQHPESATVRGGHLLANLHRNHVHNFAAPTPATTAATAATAATTGLPYSSTRGPSSAPFAVGSSSAVGPYAPMMDTLNGVPLRPPTLPTLIPLTIMDSKDRKEPTMDSKDRKEPVRHTRSSTPHYTRASHIPCNWIVDDSNMSFPQIVGRRATWETMPVTAAANTTANITASVAASTTASAAASITASAAASITASAAASTTANAAAVACLAQQMIPPRIVHQHMAVEGEPRTVGGKNEANKVGKNEANKKTDPKARTSTSAVVNKGGKDEKRDQAVVADDNDDGGSLCLVSVHVHYPEVVKGQSTGMWKFLTLNDMVAGEPVFVLKLFIAECIEVECSKFWLSVNRYPLLDTLPLRHYLDLPEISYRHTGQFSVTVTPQAIDELPTIDDHTLYKQHRLLVRAVRNRAESLKQLQRSKPNEEAQKEITALRNQSAAHRIELETLNTELGKKDQHLRALTNLLEAKNLEVERLLNDRRATVVDSIQSSFTHDSVNLLHTFPLVSDLIDSYKRFMDGDRVTLIEAIETVLVDDDIEGFLVHQFVFAIIFKCHMTALRIWKELHQDLQKAPVRSLQLKENQIVDYSSLTYALGPFCRKYHDKIHLSVFDPLTQMHPVAVEETGRCDLPTLPSVNLAPSATQSSVVAPIVGVPPCHVNKTCPKPAHTAICKYNPNRLLPNDDSKFTVNPPTYACYCGIAEANVAAAEHAFNCPLRSPATVTATAAATAAAAAAAAAPATAASAAPLSHFSGRTDGPVISAESWSTIGKFAELLRTKLAKVGAHCPVPDMVRNFTTDMTNLCWKMLVSVPPLQFHWPRPLDAYQRKLHILHYTSAALAPDDAAQVPPPRVKLAMYPAIIKQGEHFKNDPASVLAEVTLSP